MNRYAGCALSIEHLMRRVLRRGFPELPSRRISAAYGDFDAWMVYDCAPGGFFIGVDNSLRGAPRQVLEGGLAHELAHIVRDRSQAPWQRQLALAAYASHPAYRIRDERATDLLAIERGFGHEILALLRHGRALGYTSCREHGLMLGELSRRLRAPE